MARSRRRKPSRKARKTKQRGRPSLLRLLGIGLVLCLLIAAGTLAWLWPRCSGSECPSVASLRDYTPPQASQVMDRSGELVAYLAPERRTVVPLEEIPPHVTGAFLAVEDRRFFQHGGIDTRRIPGAIRQNVRSRRFDEGFSTLTMQLARNVFPEHLSREKTLRRKLWEVVLALRIEGALSKDQILELYLNQIYLGDGAYGVEAAAEAYFGTSVRELNLSQAALLAALPRAPSYYNPRRNEAAAMGRRDLVLRRMVREGVVDADEASAARDRPLALVEPFEARGEAPYFVAAVRRELRARFGEDAETAGLRVFTGLDPELQRSAERRLEDQIAAIESGGFGVYAHPSCGEGRPPEPDACLQGMFVGLDPASGDVRALVGGRDFGWSQFDRATQARRQSGSAFKPFVYATALAAGVPVTTALLGGDAEPLEPGYVPADHVSDSLRVDLREGMRLSSNRAAVALGQRVGAGRVVQTARTMGISTPMHEYPSTFLGAADVVPLELVAAYAAFGTGGRVARPRLIQRVENARGRILMETPVERRQVLPPGAAFLTLNLMEDVVNRGTGAAVRAAGLNGSVPAAGKTGTTNDAADVWFVGTTPDLVAGIWLGFDRPRRIMTGATGGRLAAPVWGRVMTDFHRDRPAPSPWRAPADVVRVSIDRESGLRANGACPEDQVADEWFLVGTEPTDYCGEDEGLEGWLRRTARGIGEWIRGEPE